MEQMRDKTVEVVLAATPRGEIGWNNTIPWKLPGDLRHFKELTMGHTLVMGRNTYESLPVALKGRTVIVVSRQLVGSQRVLENVEKTKVDPTKLSSQIRQAGWGVTLKAEEDHVVYAASSLPNAMRIAHHTQGEKIFIAGGASLYEWALCQPNEMIDKVHLTTVYKPSPNGYDTRIKNFTLHWFNRTMDPRVMWEEDKQTGQCLVSHTYSEYGRK